MPPTRSAKKARYISLAHPRIATIELSVKAYFFATIALSSIKCAITVELSGDRHPCGTNNEAKQVVHQS